MPQYKTSDNFPPYTQHISREFLKLVTSYYKVKNIFDFSFHKSQEMFKMMSLCLKAVLKIVKF